MRKNRKTLLLTSILTMSIIWAFIYIQRSSNIIKGLDLVIFILIFALAGIAIYRVFKKDKEEQEGQPSDDEMSLMIKYKSGYYSYLISMYMWLFIFLFKDKFPDIETMLGGGILLSALIAFITKSVIKRKVYE